MKIKLMIALVVLALVFGLVLVACDSGELPKISETAESTTSATGSTSTFKTSLDIYLISDGVVNVTGGIYNDNLINPNRGSTIHAYGEDESYKDMIGEILDDLLSPAP